MGFAGLGIWLAAATVARAQTLQDQFADRQTITSSSGDILGDNQNATIEPGEPRHGGKPGGRSLWISWVAPADGVVNFEVDNATFDTLLSAYYFVSTNDTTFDKLVPVMVADDSEGLDRESEITFGVLAGQRYEIAVDGYFGAGGSFEFEWDFESTPVPPPIVFATPPDQAVILGDPLTLTVALTNAANAQFKWFFNGNELEASSPTLLLPSVQEGNVGRYKLRIQTSGPAYFTSPTEIQINTDGATNALAQGKVLDAPSTALVGQGGGSPMPLLSRPAEVQVAGGGVGVVRGYNGSQVFNTTYALVDTSEPPHCGVSNGVSYWLSYQPPASGVLTLDTLGSAYDTVLEAYTHDGELTGYQDLISLACDNDGFGTNGPSRISFPVIPSRRYLVVVQGVNGARGTAWLNYQLNTNQQPPVLLSAPSPQVAAAGSEVQLRLEVAGTAPLSFSWKKNNVLLPGHTGPVLLLPEVTTNDSANYEVTVTNEFGSVVAALPLRVLVAPVCELSQTAEGLELSFATVPGQRYIIEEARSGSGPWTPWSPSYLGDGDRVAVYPSVAGNAFFRVRVE